MNILDASEKNIVDLTGLEYATRLVILRLQNNQIEDISPLTNLTSLTFLLLDNNQISDVSPLISNPGLSQGDEVYLSNNPLSITSMNTYIPQLQARGVIIYWP
jgi:internalin A